ncbi:MAG: hypothetical protein FJ104_01945 [Deltaproteobacteria bacterium]|nr:hypothetical protein [Deltaproteobacteria bacterium]
MSERLWAPLCGTTYPLAPLDVEATSALLGAVLPEGVSSSRVAEAIHRHTGGNPFFVEEVCRSLSEATRDIGPVAWENALLEGALPSSIHDVLRARMDRLRPEDGELLSLAAVVGGEFTAALLAEVAGLDEPVVDASLVRLAEAELIHERAAEAGTFRFNHRVTREVAYEALLRARRRDLHERIALAIERATPEDRRHERCETLAHHFGASGRVEEAITYSILAGDKASRGFALDDAQRYYGNVLGWIDGLPPLPEHRRRRVQISVRWAGACVFRPGAAQLDTLMRSAADCEALDLPADGGRIRYWLGWLAHALGDQEQAIRHFEAGIPLAERSGSPRLMAQLHAALGQSSAAATEYECAHRQFDKAFEVAATVGAEESTRTVATKGGWLAYALGYLALMAGDVGEFDRARELLDDALARVRMAGLSALEGSVVTQCAIVHAYQGAFAECLESALRMRAIADRSALPYVLGMSRTAEGYARFYLSDGTAGLDALRQAATFLGSRGLSLTLSWNLALLAECLALSGDAAEAESHARAALRRGQVQDRMGELIALRALGLAAAARRPEHPEEAAALFEEARARARAKQNHREEALTTFRLGEMWLRAGERARALACLETVVLTFERMKMPWHAERARRLLSR